MAETQTKLTGLKVELIVGDKDFEIVFLILIDNKFPPLEYKLNMDNIKDHARDGDAIIFLFDKPIECKKVEIGTNPVLTKNVEIQKIQPIWGHAT